MDDKERDKLCGGPPTLTWTCKKPKCGKVIGPMYSQSELDKMVKWHQVNEQARESGG